jgi:HAD superfamily phosphatase
VPKRIGDNSPSDTCFWWALSWEANAFSAIGGKNSKKAAYTEPSLFVFMSELFIRQDLFKSLPQIDAILFDIDGVLLDVSLSFRAAIVETTQHYAKNTLHLEDTGKLILPEEVELFKFAGGFNDDWDLTNAAVALVIAKWAQTGATDTQTIRDASPSWEEYTSAIKRRGGGLVEAEGFILEMLGSTERREFARHWNARLVTRLFQEFYGGDDACRDLYGFDPEYIHGEGFYKREKAMVDPTLIPGGMKCGVVTGRAKPETRLGLRHAKLLNRIKEEGWVTPESGAKKPDGKTLMLARDALDFKFGLYIGDIMDDLQTVLNYRELRGAGKARIISAIVLSGPSGATHRRDFLEAGADIVAPDVNFLLQYLKGVLK